MGYGAMVAQRILTPWSLVRFQLPWFGRNTQLQLSPFYCNNLLLSIAVKCYARFSHQKRWRCVFGFHTSFLHLISQCACIPHNNSMQIMACSLNVKTAFMQMQVHYLPCRFASHDGSLLCKC